MKLFLLVAFFSLVCTSAYSMEFVLKCRSSFEGVKSTVAYQVVKVATGSNGQWVTSYKIRMMSPSFAKGPMEFALEPDGSGDEDYNTYNVIDPRRVSGLSGAAIQNRFAWVSLIDNEGISAYNCRSEYK